MRVPRPGATESILLACALCWVAFLCVTIFRLSASRAFNFDEFQVLYASAALIRGKALYGDQVGSHFPFVNILFSWLIRGLGFHPHTLLAARILTFLFLCLTLLFTFRIGSLFWKRPGGLLAVALTVCTTVVVDRGIEIRHDVFNMTFNTMGAYWGLKYLKERDPSSIWLSGFFLGLALASTQKAIAWNIGILVGLTGSVLMSRKPGRSGLHPVFFSVVFLCPLILCLLYLLLNCGESPEGFIKVALGKASGYLDPEKANRLYPFPYTKTQMFRELARHNGLFYLLSLVALMASLREWAKRGTARSAVGLWALAGLLFYGYTSRPFFQSLLPTIPPLSIVTAGFLMDLRGNAHRPSWRKGALAACLIWVLLLGWPSYLIARLPSRVATMTGQMTNVSFCLQNLKTHDTVLCFTQNQIFFDPVLRMSEDACGPSISRIEEDCFERKMIRDKCKVVIYDHRTRFLSRGIQKKVRNHYLPTGTGDIWVPGFVIGPRQKREMKIWVSGTYYCPTNELMINGNRAGGHLIDLEQTTVRLGNPTGRAVHLFYIFDREGFMDPAEKRSSS